MARLWVPGGCTAMNCECRSTYLLNFYKCHLPGCTRPVWSALIQRRAMMISRYEWAVNGMWEECTMWHKGSVSYTWLTSSYELICGSFWLATNNPCSVISDCCFVAFCYSTLELHWLEIQILFPSVCKNAWLAIFGCLYLCNSNT